MPSLDATVEAKAVLVNKSTDGGLTWSAPTTLVQGNSDDHDKDSITADPTNAQLAYATWTRFRNAGGATMFSRTTDGGQTWEPARAILDPGGNNINQGHQIVVLPDGTLVNFFSQILFKNQAGGTSHVELNLSLIRSSDKGQTWQAPIHVATIFALNDTLTVPGGRGVPNPDGGAGIRALNFFFDVAVDPTSGNLCAVWQDARFSNFQHTSIAFAMSADGGFTWSAPIRVNQTPDNIPVGNRQAFLPSVAVAADGTVAVTYYDFRNNTSAPGLLTDYWMVHAHPNTDLTNLASWASENRLTKRSFDMEQALNLGTDGFFVGDYMGLSAAGSNFAALWAMPHKNQDGTIDLGSIFFRDPLPSESTAVFEALGTPAEVREVSSLHGIDLPLADLGGTAFGIVSGHQGEQRRIDLPTLPLHEISPLLGQGHESDGLMAQTLTGGTRHDLSLGGDLFDVMVLDRVFADSRTALAVPFSDGSVC